MCNPCLWQFSKHIWQVNQKVPLQAAASLAAHGNTATWRDASSIQEVCMCGGMWMDRHVVGCLVELYPCRPYLNSPSILESRDHRQFLFVVQFLLFFWRAGQPAVDRIRGNYEASSASPGQEGGCIAGQGGSFSEKRKSLETFTWNKPGKTKC